MPKSVNKRPWWPALVSVKLAFAGALAVASITAPHAAAVKTEHVEVELVAARDAAVAGETVMLGLSMKHAPHWHSYWKNPGDSGYPTKITWTAPFAALPEPPQFVWPTPKRLATGPIVNFGYEGTVLLPIVMALPSGSRPGDTVTYSGKAEWLVCKDVCIPEEGVVTVTLPVVASAAQARPSAHADRFAAALASAPGAATQWRATLFAPPGAAREVWLSLTPPAGSAALNAIDVFPETEQITDPSLQQSYRTADGYAVRLKLAEGAKLADRLPLVIAADSVIAPEGKTSATMVATVALSEYVLPTGAVGLAGAGAGVVGGGAGGGGDVTLLSALLLAFLGGMILNLMPCVFPVLTLKILSFAKHGGGLSSAASAAALASASAPTLVHDVDRPRGRGRSRWLRNGAQGAAATALPDDHERTVRAAMRHHGLFYAVGVVLSFLALAAVLLALKGAGSAIGWGFQLQSPGVVWVLAIIFFLIGLNLMGAFEVGQLAPSALLSMQAKHPGTDAFFSGVLAVVAASPCTAPFMGAALGFALTQSTGAALSVFAALGVGMALPYVLLAWFPRWLENLPRPGRWMVTFKQLLAFPMFATVVWLVWVLAMQAGVDGAAVGLLGLVGLAFGAWLIGSPRAGARWAGAAVVAVAAALAWPSAEVSTAAPGAVKSGAVTWQPWDAATVDTLVAEGKPVFVDFTAAWCVSCQVNKRAVLTRSEIEQLFAAKKVTLMRADWTNRDERITKALAAMNRSGVPVYVLHAPGKPPQLLPEILTMGVVRDALGALP